MLEVGRHEIVAQRCCQRDPRPSLDQINPLAPYDSCTLPGLTCKAKGPKVLATIDVSSCASITAAIINNRQDHYPVTRLEVYNVVAHFRHSAAEFMAKSDRIAFVCQGMWLRRRENRPREIFV